jgi:transcriptional regulator with XRE-family HTH domain
MKQQGAEMEFGYKLRELRNAKGIGLRDFAKLIDKSPSYLSNIERGVVPPPTAEVIILIADALDGDTEELLELANRFNINELETLRKNAIKLEKAEQMIKFLSGAAGLDDSEPIGGIAGIVELLTGELLLDPTFSKKSNFQRIRYLLQLISASNEKGETNGIELRRELGRTIMENAIDFAHPFQNNPEEKFRLDESIASVFKKYPTALLKEVIKNEELGKILQQLSETESEKAEESS